ncbi:MAG: DUF63 family protein [Haloarculaceae archaeon]
MQLLPSGFALPPLLYLFALLGGTGVVVALLYAIEPPVGQTTAVALAPWMALGGGLHALHQIGAYPDLYRPLFGTPAVYLTLFVLAGFVWILLALVATVRGRMQNLDRNLGLVGLAILSVLVVVVVRRGVAAGTLALAWPAISVVVATLVAAVTVLLVSLWRTPVFVRTRLVGPLVVFAHALDGVTTAVGADVLGVTERTPIPRAIMEFAASLPTAQYVGVGWLFVLVKLAVASAVVVLMARYVEEDPAEGSLLMALIAAVGLGPATNNLLLFMLGG